MDIKRPAPKPSRLSRSEPPVTPQAAASSAPHLPSLDLPPASRSLGTPRKKPRWLLWLLMSLGAFVVVAAVALFVSVGWYNGALQPKSDNEKPVTVKVESGATIDQIGKELEQKALIKSSLAFTIYMKLNGKSVKTGTYTFAASQPVSQIVEWLDTGRVSTRKVTIVPGKTLKQIRQLLIDNGYTAEDVDAALAAHYDHPLLAEKPATAGLEGYIFPETYFVESDSSAQDLLKRTFDEFEKQIDNHQIRQKLSARGFNLYEGITLASIVGREVTKPDVQKQVAQVFETRLERGMLLGSDVTYHYAADLLGVSASSTIDSPYNTRIYAGLPPGPIANFNLSALEAVAEPAAGDYLYFVAGDDGVTYFARTFEEHQVNINRHCVKLCSGE